MEILVILFQFMVEIDSNGNILIRSGDINILIKEIQIMNLLIMMEI